MEQVSKGESKGNVVHAQVSGAGIPRTLCPMESYFHRAIQSNYRTKSLSELWVPLNSFVTMAPSTKLPPMFGDETRLPV